MGVALLLTGIGFLVLMLVGGSLQPALCRRIQQSQLWRPALGYKLSGDSAR